MSEDLPVTRGFVGRRRPAQPERLPPGQYDVGRQWPVLSAEVTPVIAPDRWSLSVDGAVERPHTWSWRDVHALPGASWSGDIHCVTTWSRLDTSFTGVAVDTLLDAVGVRDDATHVVVHSSTGYTTNLPLDDVRGQRAFVVWEADGKPLTAEHGGPVRMVVPHLYFWKSTKWVSRIEVVTTDRPGFWERNGYHDRGDPWREQRYQGDP